MSIEDLPMFTRSWRKLFPVPGSVEHQHHNVGLPSAPLLVKVKPAAYYTLRHLFIVQTPLSPTLYKKKLVFSEQKLLLLLGWDFPDLWVILIKPRNVLKAVALETTNHFIVEA